MTCVFKKMESGPAGERLMRSAMDTLAANIRFTSEGAAPRLIAIASSTPSEGKSTIALELARTLAQDGETVLLVDCDVRNRTLARHLGVRARTGLYSALLGNVAIEDAMVCTKIEGLYLLDVEPDMPSPASVLGSTQFKDLLARLRETFGFVVLDTPPLASFVDGALVAAAADTAVMVARWDFTKRDDIKNSVEQLRAAGARIAGVVANCYPQDRDYHYYAGNEQAGGDTPHIVARPVAPPATPRIQEPAAEPAGEGTGTDAPAAYEAPSADDRTRPLAPDAPAAEPAAGEEAPVREPESAT